MISQPDSISKIVTAYFAALTRSPFEFRGRRYEPKELLVSPLLFRGYTCPSSCGGCCHRVTLDWLPSEPHPESARPRSVVFNGRGYLLLSDLQEHDRPKCHYLRMEDGRCEIHGHHPLPCDFELIKLIHYEDKALLVQKKYGRSWSFTRVDGGRGSLCEMTPVTDETRAEVVRKLKRIRDWTTYFDLDSHIDDVIIWAESYPVDQPLRLSVQDRKLLDPAARID